MRGLVGSARSCHVAVFQDDPTSLLQHVHSFVGTKLERGGAVVLIVEPVLAETYRAWAAEQRASVRHRCIILDAAATLEQLCNDGRVDPDRFEERIGGIVRRARTMGNGRVAAVGEMAGLLWRVGRQKDAIELETLWHEAVPKLDIRLLCPYSYASFRHDPAGVCHVLHVHSHVEALPTLQPEEETAISAPREPHVTNNLLGGRPRRPQPAGRTSQVRRR